MFVTVLALACADRCPPGHGDIYPALLGTGMLARLREKGINYVFVSNSDNLGATLDLDLLAYFAQSGNGFLMEVEPDSFPASAGTCLLAAGNQ